MPIPMSDRQQLQHRLWRVPRNLHRQNEMWFLLQAHSNRRLRRLRRKPCQQLALLLRRLPLPCQSSNSNPSSSSSLPDLPTALVTFFNFPVALVTRQSVPASRHRQFLSRPYHLDQTTFRSLGRQRRQRLRNPRHQGLSSGRSRINPLPRHRNHRAARCHLTSPRHPLPLPQANHISPHSGTLSRQDSIMGLHTHHMFRSSQTQHRDFPSNNHILY